MSAEAADQIVDEIEDYSQTQPDPDVVSCPTNADTEQDVSHTGSCPTILPTAECPGAPLSCSESCASAYPTPAGSRAPTPARAKRDEKVPRAPSPERNSVQPVSNILTIDTPIASAEPTPNSTAANSPGQSRDPTIAREENKALPTKE